MHLNYLKMHQINGSYMHRVLVKLCRTTCNMPSSLGIEQLNRFQMWPGGWGMGCGVVPGRVSDPMLNLISKSIHFLDHFLGHSCLFDFLPLVNLLELVQLSIGYMIVNIELTKFE